MPEWLSTAGNTIIWIASLLGAAIIIATPIIKLNKNQKISNTMQQEGQACQYLLMRDTIRWRHDYWIARKYCPQVEKENTSEMYDMYRGKDQFGQPVRNGLSLKYINEMLTLPEEKPCGNAARDTNAGKE